MRPKWLMSPSSLLIVLGLMAAASLAAVLLGEALEDDELFDRSRLVERPARFDREDQGDEFSGQVSAWLLAAASLPVALDLTARWVTRRASPSANLKSTIQRLNLAQRKRLMPLHTYLSLGALASGVLHLSRSACQSSSLPEWGLAGLAILVGSGLVIKLKLAPKSWRKGMYQAHVSLLVSGLFGLVLVGGHLSVT